MQILILHQQYFVFLFQNLRFSSRLPFFNPLRVFIPHLILLHPADHVVQHFGFHLYSLVLFIYIAYIFIRVLDLGFKTDMHFFLSMIPSPHELDFLSHSVNFHFLLFSVLCHPIILLPQRVQIAWNDLFLIKLCSRVHFFHIPFIRNVFFGAIKQVSSVQMRQRSWSCTCLWNSIVFRWLIRSFPSTNDCEQWFGSLSLSPWRT